MGDAARCSGCCTALCRRGEQFRYSLPRNSSPASCNSGIRSHQFGFPLPSIQIFVPIDSNSCFHGCCRSFLWTQSPASINSGIRFHRFKFLFPRILSFLSTNSIFRFHEFTFSLPRISIFAFTDSDIPPHECRKTKKTSFCGDVFLYRFSFKWRCLADSNRRRRFCRPLTKPLIQGTIP